MERKNRKKRKRKGGEKKEKCESKKKKAYIAWDENASSTLSDSSNEEKENLCLMADGEVDSMVSTSDSRKLILMKIMINF